MTFILGVTGGIGCGKSAATERFATHGISIIDADNIAHQVVEPPSTALNKIANHFGNNILCKDGSLNRGKLRKIVFNSASEKNWLEQLLHPIIRDKILSELKLADSPYAILSAPLLLENDLDKICHRVLAIDCDENIQIQRTQVRDKSDEAVIRNIINQQIDRKARLQRADDIISNNGSLDELYQQVDNYHHQLLQQLAYE